MLQSPASCDSQHSHESLVLATNIDLVIALHKGKDACIFHPFADFPLYNALSPSFQYFITSLNSTMDPHYVSEALKHRGCRSTMEDKMSAIRANDTRDLIPLPYSKSVVGCS